MKPLTSDEGPRCDGCGKLARRNKDGKLILLKRCSRCRNASYHDATCQKMHYPLHRRACQTSGLVSRQSTTNDGDVFSVVERPRRGRCVIAARHLPAHLFLGANSNNHDAATESRPFFPPLAIPVLNRSHRRERCALCLGRLAATSLVLLDNPICPILICSDECRRRSSKAWLVEHEISCLQFLYGDSNQLGPPTLLPTAILMFRVLLEATRSEELDKLLQSLQAHESTMLSEDGAIHQEAVVRTVQSLCQASLLLHGKETSCISRLPDTKVLQQLWNRVKYNAFTVADDGANGSNEPVGIGLYQTPAHYFNHSCSPNAIQFFEFKRGEPPRLHVETSQDMAPGEEICIRYCEDVPGQSRDERRMQLHEQYRFWCDCKLCLAGISCLPHCSACQD